MAQAAIVWGKKTPMTELNAGMLCCKIILFLFLEYGRHCLKRICNDSWGADTSVSNWNNFTEFISQKSTQVWVTEIFSLNFVPKSQHKCQLLNISTKLSSQKSCNRLLNLIQPSPSFSQLAELISSQPGSFLQLTTCF